MFRKSYSILNLNCKRPLSFQKQSGYDWEKLDKALLEPWEYIKNFPYKHYIMMVPTFNHWLQLPKEKYDRIHRFTKDYVAWTILIDDIRDNSQFRHGVPTANRIFGMGATINAVSKSLFKVQKQIIDLGHPLALQKFMDRTEEALHGEGIDIYWRDHMIYPPVEAHIEMTKKKGGAYFAVPVDLMQLFSSNEKDYTNIAINIGSYFEILDDYYNLFHPKALPRLVEKVQVSMATSVPSMENHGVNSDITEGKISLAMIHASQFPDVATELADILKQRTSDPKLKNRFISLLKKHGSDEYMKDKLNKLEAHIRAEIEQHGGNPTLCAFMDDLSFQKHEQAPQQMSYS